jgi:hypothetical protein
MRELTALEILCISGGNSTSDDDIPEIVIIGERPNNYADAVLSAAVGAVTRGAVVSFAEGLAVGAGLAAGSTFLVAAPVIGAGLGAYVAYKAFFR